MLRLSCSLYASGPLSNVRFKDTCISARLLTALIATFAGRRQRRRAGLVGEPRNLPPEMDIAAVQNVFLSQHRATQLCCTGSIMINVEPVSINLSLLRGGVSRSLVGNHHFWRGTTSILISTFLGEHYAGAGKGSLADRVQNKRFGPTRLNTGPS